MKKIGICIDSLEMGGAEKLLVDIIKMLFETKKYKIYLVTKNESNSDFYKEIKEKVEYSYLISKDTEKRNRRYGEVGKFFTSLEKRRNFKKFKKDVDLIIDFLDGDFYKFLKNVKDKKKIVWLHSGYKELQIKKKIDKKLNSYNQTIVITEAM
ncbi:MAG: glycosyltransferase, partial [Cetobacterium sp.]